MAAFAVPTSSRTETSTYTETNTWKRVDKALNDGVRAAKKKFVDAHDTVTKTSTATGTRSSTGTGPEGELDKVADSLNEAWDSVLKGAGKVLKTQQTSTNTQTSTNSQ